VDWKQVFDFTPQVPANVDVSSLGVHGTNQWPAIEGFQETMEKYLEVSDQIKKIY
jgi:hypothetical protein